MKPSLPMSANTAAQQKCARLLAQSLRNPATLADLARDNPDLAEYEGIILGAPPLCREHPPAPRPLPAKPRPAEREETGALHLLRPGRPGPGATGVRLPPGIDPPCFCPGIFWRRHRPGTAKLPRPHPAQETDEDCRKLRGHRPPVHPGLCPAMGAGVREKGDR